MSLQLILGGSGSGKSHLVYERIIEQSIAHEEMNYLVIVPEQFTMQTQKDLVSMHPHHGIMNIDILSFLRLAYRIFEEVGEEEKVILEDTGKTMLLRKVVAQKKNDLVLFQSNIHKQGFIGELKSLVSEMFQYSISLEQLMKMEQEAEGKPMLKTKLRDIITIYSAFADMIHEKYITAEEILDVLFEVLDYSKIIRQSVICFDGFTGFTPSQYKLIEKLLTLSKQVIVTVTIDQREDIHKVDEEHKLFHLSKKTIDKLVKIADEANVKVLDPIYPQNLYDCQVPYRFKDSKALASLEYNIYRYPSKVFQGEVEDISIHTATDANLEVGFTIREIKRLVREGYRYKDIAIVTGDIESYGRIYRREMERAGIPCFIDHKKDILSNPYIELLRSAMEVVQKDFSYESVFRYLRCSLSNYNKEDVDLLENYVIAFGIRRMGMWEKQWKAIYRNRMPVDLEKMNELRIQVVDDIRPLLEVFKDKTATVLDYTRALYEFSVRKEASKKLEAYAEYFKERNLPLLAKEYEQIYRIVVELFDKYVELLGDEKIPLNEYSKILEAGFTEAKVGLIPPGMDQIVVGDMTRTRLKDIKALFVVGVNEGVIPSASKSGGILSDMDREIFLQNQVELAPTSRQNAYIEQFYIYLNLTKPSNRLYLSYSNLGQDGKSLRPSYLIGKMKKMFPKIQTYNEDLNDSLEKILGKRGGMEYIIEGLREVYVKEPDDVFKELFNYYKKNLEGDAMETLIKGAFYNGEEKGISKVAAQMLYGNELIGSVTRLEKYAACAFAHFVAYGLRLQERPEYKLANPDIGNIFHMALDLFSERLQESDYTWRNIPDGVREEWASYCVAVAIEQYGNTVFTSTSRNEYLVKKVERITKRTVWALSQQLKLGLFDPTGYELGFTYLPVDDVSEDPVNIKLTGRIDRLDTYEEEDKLYLKVVDYKSGNTTFDFVSFYYGLQMQLLVYLNAAIQMAQKVYKDKDLIPAGILYYHINDPVVNKTEDVDTEILKELQMNGIINADMNVIKIMDTSFDSGDGSIRPKTKSVVIPAETDAKGTLKKKSGLLSKQEFKALSAYVDANINKFGKEICDGNTEVNPYKLGNRTACDYCEYKGICGFDTKLPGYAYRRLLKLSKDKIMEDIKEGDKDDEMDHGATESNRSKE